MSETRLCALEEIEDGESKGFNTEINGQPANIFAVRQGSDVFVYENSCPHIGTPLNMMPDEFLSDDGGHIECSTHLALFRIEDGLCTDGPCEGDILTKINATVRDGDVFVEP